MGTRTEVKIQWADGTIADQVVSSEQPNYCKQCIDAGPGRCDFQSVLTTAEKAAYAFVKTDGVYTHEPCGRSYTILTPAQIAEMEAAEVRKNLRLLRINGMYCLSHRISDTDWRKVAKFFKYWSAADLDDMDVFDMPGGYYLRPGNAPEGVILNSPPGASLTTIQVVEELLDILPENRVGAVVNKQTATQREEIADSQRREFFQLFATDIAENWDSEPGDTPCFKVNVPILGTDPWLMVSMDRTKIWKMNSMGLRSYVYDATPERLAFLAPYMPAVDDPDVATMIAAACRKLINDIRPEIDLSGAAHENTNFRNIPFVEIARQGDLRVHLGRPFPFDTESDTVFVKLAYGDPAQPDQLQKRYLEPLYSRPLTETERNDYGYRLAEHYNRAFQIDSAALRAEFESLLPNWFGSEKIGRFDPPYSVKSWSKILFADAQSASWYCCAHKLPVTDIRFFEGVRVLDHGPSHTIWSDETISKTDVFTINGERYAPFKTMPSLFNVESPSPFADMTKTAKSLVADAVKYETIDERITELASTVAVNSDVILTAETGGPAGGTKVELSKMLLTLDSGATINIFAVNEEWWISGGDADYYSARRLYSARAEAEAQFAATKESYRKY